MSLMLDSIGARVGQETIIESVSLALRRGTMNMLPRPGQRRRRQRKPDTIVE